MAISTLFIPAILLLFLVMGAVRRVPLYDTFVKGAKEGLMTAWNVAPYILCMTIFIGILRSGGLQDVLTGLMRPLVSWWGFPEGVLPMALVRPLSGSAALSMLQEIMANYGPDSFEGRVAGIMMGSTETIFYTLTLYFGAANVQKTRYALPGALLAMLAGTIASVFFATM